MIRFRMSPVILSGVLLIATAVTLPLAPAFGEGGARCDTDSENGGPWVMWAGTPYAQ